MIVSELSAGYGQVYKYANNGINHHASDNNETKEFEVYSPFTNNNDVKQNLDMDRFDAINQWKYFCYKQLVDKKLDILA